MAQQGINKVIIIGNLGNDPETRFFPDGGAITNASIATSESWKDKNTGEDKEVTEWHKVVFRDRGNYKLGQWAGEWLRKGSKVYVEGKLQTRKWQDSDGQDRYMTEIIATEMQNLSPRDTGASAMVQPGAVPAVPGGPQTEMGKATAIAQARSGVSPGQRRGPDPSQAPPVLDSFEDDIPF